MSSCSSSTGSGNTGGSNGNSGGSNGTGTGGQSASGGTTGSGDGGSNGTGSGGSNSTGNGGSTSGNGGSTGSGGVVGSGGSNPTGKGGSTGSGGSNPTGAGGSNPTGSGGSTGTGGSAPTQPVLVTSASGAYWKTDGTLTAGTGSGTVTVNDSGAKQTWEGMGGAFNEIGWQQIQTLSADDQTKAVNLLFGADGAHFVIGRIPIGASDYAIARYSEDETAGDMSLTNFSISQDMKYLIPFVKAAQKVNPNIRFWGSPWTPPTWMKTRSGSVTNGSATTTCGNPSGSDSDPFDGGCMNATSANLSTYAQYFAKWVQAYAGQQITIEAVAPQNEPDYSQGYPSCIWKASDYVAFVPVLAQAVNSMGTKVMLGTMSNGDNGQQSADLAVANAVMADSTAKSIPKMVGLQWGMLDIFTGNASWLNIGSLPVWATEHKCGNYPWNPSGYPKYVEPAPNDQAYAVESWGYIDKAIKAGVTAYNAWNMILDGVGKGNDKVRQWAQDTLLTVKPSKCNGNAISSSLCATPAYYVFRHVSQYAQAGGHVLTTSGGDAIAFKNPDGSEVAVMYNSGGANSSYSVSIAGKKYTFAMPAQGWATVFVPAGS